MRKIILVAVSVLLCMLLTVGCTDSKQSGNDKVSSSPTDISSDVSSGSDDALTNESSESNDATSDDVGNSSSKPENNSSVLDNGNSSAPSDPEANSLMKDEIIPKGNTSILLRDVKGGADAEADALRNKIVNTKDELAISGTKYYISSKTGDDSNDGLTPETAWQTADAATLNSFLLKEGDAVLFERGCVFRPTSQIFCKTGVTYGAYGKGDKPIIYGSVRNYSYPGLWTPSNKKNVWKMTLALEDAGILVFEHGKFVGCKKTGLLSVNENYDFYHNVSENTFYLYLDKGRPNQVHKDIEIGTRRSVFTLISGVSDVRIDNICIKYVGSHAIQNIADQKNVVITNCEIGWVGGSYMEDGKETRYGNGIQFWYDASNCLVNNCWIYQVYDTGLTFQGPEDSIFENVDFTNNLIEYTCMAVETWVGSGRYGKPLTGYVKDCDIVGNILRFSGYEWSAAQRPNAVLTAFINAGNEGSYNIKSMSIKNNIFDRTTYYYYKFSKNDASNVVLGNNTYYGQIGKVASSVLFCNEDDLVNVTDFDSFKEAILKIEGNPQKIAWCDN